jgi:hypothetical protein
MLLGCGRVAGEVAMQGEAAAPASPTPPSADSPNADLLAKPGGAHYPGSGFVVHEWGTNTVVVGSDGSMQRGLHHEEEDLPTFVYDRIKAGEMGLSVDVKMETPVTYFYSDKPMTANVSVGFPKGVLTQWYPGVRAMQPGLTHNGDPVMDVHFPFSTSQCASRYSGTTMIANGLLDWGSVSVLARGVSAPVPDAPIDRYGWAYARAVDSNFVQVGSESERFLFYRGLGNFNLPVTVTGYGGVTLNNADPSNKTGAVFVLDVDDTSATFSVHSDGIAPGATLTEPYASPSTPRQPLDGYSKALAAAMVPELDKTGLYRDEAVAMVNTWQRQWFRTPGVRILYLAPQAWTDAQIPLTIDPAPTSSTRVMMIRVELLTPGMEEVDAKNAAALEEADNAVFVQYFANLGRFEEPRLRRAMQLLSPPGPKAAALLAQIARADTSAGIGE